MFTHVQNGCEEKLILRYVESRRICNELAGVKFTKNDKHHKNFTDFIEPKKHFDNFLEF